MPKTAVRSLGLLVALIASAPLPASTLSLAWTPAANAVGYRVYYGTRSGQYDRYQEVGTGTSATITGLQDCTDYFLAVKAYNGAGESQAFSNEIAGWSRPDVAVPTPSAGMQGSGLTLRISGANFRPGATVAIDNPHLQVASATVLDCRHLQLAVSLDPQSSGLRAAEIGSFAVTVTNPDGTFRTLSDGFEVAIDPERFDVNASRDSTRGRIDGQDTVWMARLFGSSETNVLYDPDFDLDGDGWIDGRDLAYLASNLGRCWSGSAWTVDACAGRH